MLKKWSRTINILGEIIGKYRLALAPIMPDLLIEGLNRYDERPCLFLGENTATYKDVREATSKMVQALLEQNLGVGSRVAVLSANRPEVLYNIAAMQLSGCAGFLFILLGRWMIMHMRWKQQRSTH